MKNFYLSISFIILSIFSHAQCVNTIQWPAFTVSASEFNDTVSIASNNFAGDYAIVDKLTIGETYQFSSTDGDYISIRNAYDHTELLAHGASPLIYSPTAEDIVSVHYNLISPPCGTEIVYRTTMIHCTTCPDIPPAVGINTSVPAASLDISGEIKVGDSGRSPEAGMIRWNADSEDFEGYNGEKWVSLTKSNTKNQWGQQSISNIKKKMVVQEISLVVLYPYLAITLL